MSERTLEDAKMDVLIYHKVYQERKCRWRHRKSGNLYDFVAYVINESDLRVFVNYHCKKTGVIWSRPADEFHDKFDPVKEDETC